MSPQVACLKGLRRRIESDLRVNVFATIILRERGQLHADALVNPFLMPYGFVLNVL